MPVRKIPIQTRSKSGYFYSYKNQRSLSYESLLEKRCFLMLEFNNEVISYEEQPVKIENYVPDILVQRKDLPPLLIEVKYSKDIEKNDDKLQLKFQSIENYCKEKKSEFMIFTEKDVTEPYFSNISLLYRYIRRNPNEEILKYVRHCGETDIDTLLKEGYSTADIYALLAQGKLSANLYNELSPITKVKSGVSYV